MSSTRIYGLAVTAMLLAIGPAVAQPAIFTADLASGTRIFLTNGSATGTRALASLGDRDDNTITFALPVGTRTVFANMRSAIHAVSSNGAIVEIADYGALLGTANGKVYIATLSGLKATDGTVAGTSLVLAYSGNTVKLATFGGKTWLAYNGSGGLVFTNVLNTADTFTMAGLSLESNLFVTGTRAVFAATAAATGTELWVTDGKKAGTRILRDVAPGATSGYNALYPIATIGKRAVFVANDMVSGNRIWGTDGTPAGTKVLVGGEKLPSSTFGVALPGRRYFLSAASASPTGYVFKSTTGASVADLTLSVAGKRVYPVVKFQKGELGSVGDKLIFEGLAQDMITPIADTGFYAYDPVARTTTLLMNINKTNDDGRARDTVTEIANVGSMVLFSAKNHRQRLSNGSFSDNQELWRSSGTPTSTKLVKDIWAGVGFGSYPRGITQIGQ